MGNSNSRSLPEDRARAQDQIDTILDKQIDIVLSDWEKQKKQYIREYFTSTYEAYKSMLQNDMNKFNSTDDTIAKEVENEDDYKKIQSENKDYKEKEADSIINKHKDEIKDVNEKEKTKDIEQDKLLNDMYKENIHRQEINRELDKIVPGSNSCSANTVERQQMEDYDNIRNRVEEENEENQEDMEGGNISKQVYLLNKRFIMNTPENDYGSIVKSSASKRKKYKI